MMSFLVKISVLLLTLLGLSACQTQEASPTQTSSSSQETTSLVTTESQSTSEALEPFLYQTSDGEKVLPQAFTGRLLLMATAEQKEKGIGDYDFSLGETSFTTVTPGSQEETQVTYEGETWYAFKSLSVTELSQLRIDTTVGDRFLVVFEAQ